MDLNQNLTVEIFSIFNIWAINELTVLCSKQAFQSIINPDWNFDKMGIGGLDSQFNAIFRRAFASRVFPPEVVEQLGTSCQLVLFFNYRVGWWRENVVMFIAVLIVVSMTLTISNAC